MKVKFLVVVICASEDAAASTVSHESAEVVNETPTGSQDFSAVKTVDSKAVADDILATIDWDVVATAVSDVANEDISCSATPSLGTRSVTAPSGVYTIFSDVMNVYSSVSSEAFGYIRGTIYVVVNGPAVVNGASGNIHTLITNVKAYPASDKCVKEYSCTYNMRIQGHTILETVTLPSGVNYSSAVALSYKAATDSIGGEATYTTTWSYNPESQIITESSINTANEKVIGGWF